MQYDAAIIGGGLAGLSLSIQLAKAGKQVILFEKEKYPFHRVCGEYIAMESWNFMESLGLDLASMNLPRIQQLRISAPNGNYLEHELSPGGFGISRYTLDLALVELAKKTGVEVLEGTKVESAGAQEIKTNQGNYQARLVFGAQGKRSNLDVKLDRRHLSAERKNYVAVKYHVQLDFPEDRIELHNFQDGYCGISKVDGDAYCLCYLTTAANFKKSGNDIKTMEEKILMKNPFLKKYFTEARFLFDQPLTISQINFHPKSIQEQNIIMLGDAAGMITPLCGNGMSMAMHASKLSFEATMNYFEEHESLDVLLKDYEQSWKNNFATRLKAGRIFQALFGNPYLTNWVIGGLKPFPRVVNKLVAFTHGDEY